MGMYWLESVVCRRSNDEQLMFQMLVSTSTAVPNSVASDCFCELMPCSRRDILRWKRNVCRSRTSV